MKRFFIWFMPATLLTGCLTDGPADDGPVGTTDDVTVMMSLNVPRAATTRGLTDGHEKTVDAVDILVFDKDLKFVDWQYGQMSYSGGEVSFSALLKASRNDADKFRLVVLANVRDVTYAAFGNGGFETYKSAGKDYAFVTGLLQAAVPGYAALESKYLPMWGELENPVKLVNNTTNEFDMDLLRSLARIDVGTNPNPQFGANGQITGWAALPNFSLEEVAVYNAQTHYALTARDSYDFTDKEVDTFTIPSTGGKASTPLLYSDNVAALGNPVSRTGGKGYALTGAIYAGEANVKMGGTYGDGNHAERMALVVAGKYNGSNNLSYYRLDFTEGTGSTLMDILRNKDYQIVIKSVSGPGKPTAAEAFESVNADMRVEIKTWTPATQSATVVEGQNWLRVSDFDFTLEKWQSLDERLTVNTNVAGNWNAVITGLNTNDEANWLRLRDIVSGNPVSSVSGTDGDDIRFSVTEFPASAPNNPRVGYIRLTAGKMKLDVKVEQSSEDTQFFLHLSDSEFVFDGRKLTNSQGTAWGAPDAKTLGISYGPRGFDYAISLSPFSGGGISFTPASSSNLSTLSITPDAIEPDDPEVEANPFFERSSKLNITVRNADNSATITKQVTIRQIYYSLLVTSNSGSDMFDYYYQNRSYSFNLRSNSPWEAVVEGDDIFDPSVVMASSGTGSTASTGQYFKFKIKGNATPGASARVTFRSPNNLFPAQTYTINAQNELPNSYMVVPGEQQQISVYKAYRTWELDRDLLQDISALPGARGAKLVWQSRPDLIAGVDFIPMNPETQSVINVRTNAGDGGNAVVAFTIDGEIYWSWHIWVTDYDPNVAAGQKMMGTTVSMDRNLGAINIIPGNAGSWGGFFQTGRKDMFPGRTGAGAWVPIYNQGGTALTLDVDGIMTNQFAPSGVGPEGVNLGNSIKNPTVYYKGNYGNQTWYGQEIRDIRTNTWGYNEYKGEYDPCPAGWRLPTSTQLSQLPLAPTVSNNTFNYGATTGLYMVAGRITQTGLFQDLGVSAYYALTTGIYRIRPGDIPRSHAGNLSSVASTVRCVKH